MFTSPQDKDTSHQHNQHQEDKNKNYWEKTRGTIHDTWISCNFSWSTGHCYYKVKTRLCKGAGRSLKVGRPMCDNEGCGDKCFKWVGPGDLFVKT